LKERKKNAMVGERKQAKKMTHTSSLGQWEFLLTFLVHRWVIEEKEFLFFLKKKIPNHNLCFSFTKTTKTPGEGFLLGHSEEGREVIKEVQTLRLSSSSEPVSPELISTATKTHC